MSTTNSKALEAKIKKQEQEAATFIGKLEAELEFARTQRLTEAHQQDLEQQIEKARAAYDNFLKPQREELQAAIAAEEKELQAMEAQIEANAQAQKQTYKSQAAMAWIQSGGSLETFDAAFEQTLWPAELMRRTQAKMEERRVEPSHAKRTTAGFGDGF
jgi:hypothetical protein